MIADAMHDHNDGISDVTAFEDAGVLCGNTGFVVKMGDGSEFQVTVIQVR